MLFRQNVHRHVNQKLSFVDRPGYWMVALVCAFLLCLVHAEVRALDFLGLGRDGKVAKYQFSLHDSFAVTAVAWSPDGAYIATSGMFSRDVHIWDVRTRRIAKNLQLQTAPAYLNDMTWSPDSSLFAVCSGQMGRLAVFNTADWSEAHAFEGKDFAGRGCVRAVFSSDGQELALLATNIAVASTATWQVKRIVDLTGWSRGRRAQDIAYLPQTHDLLLGGDQFDSIVIEGRSLQSQAGYVWWLKDGEQVPSRPLRAYATAAEHGGEVTCMAIRPDGKEFATGTGTGVGGVPIVNRDSVHFFDLQSRVLLSAPLDGNLDFGEQAMLSYSHDGRYIFVGHRDSQSSAIHIINASSHTIIDMVRSKKSVFGVSPEGGGSRFAATSGNDIDVWSMP